MATWIYGTASGKPPGSPTNENRISRKMAESNKTKLKTLMKEIDNLVKLLVKVDKGSEPMDTLTGQKQKILDMLPVTPPDDESLRDDGLDGLLDDVPVDSGMKEGTDPLHKLLSCRPLTKTEIPLDVLEKLIESGFNVNSRGRIPSCNQGDRQDTCLNLAIKNDHFAAARWLVQHCGADCDNGSIEFGWNGFFDQTFITPIAELASNANAPLDLFDLLATEHNLNYDEEEEEEEDRMNLPLEIAIKKGRTANALRLIKLGSLINSSLIKSYRMEYHDDELFTCLIPSETIDILQCVEEYVENVWYPEGYEEYDLINQNRTQIITRLLQYIRPADQMSVRFVLRSVIDSHVCYGISMNGKFPSSRAWTLKQLYWWSQLFVSMGWRFEPTPKSIDPLVNGSASVEDVELAHGIEDTWKTYRDTCIFISLQNLCIQQTRRSMQDFSEESFMSLPVPNKLRRLLMYQHVAEIACKISA